MSIEVLCRDFIEIEKQHFTILNKYIMGVIQINDIDSFKSVIDDFRSRLYTFSVNDDNIVEIAMMKSKIQCFYTEILEDEDVLKVAYNNSFSLYRKVITE